MPTEASLKAEGYARDFAKALRLGTQVDQKCEWTCLLWSKEHWAFQARKSAIDLVAAKETLNQTGDNSGTLETLSHNSMFLNTVARLYSDLFDGTERTCPAKNFSVCPFIAEREQLLDKGTKASVFATILHKAVSYSMLDKHPLDSGLLPEEYSDVYGIDLTNYEDLEASLTDGRFEKLYGAVVKLGRQLAGIATTH